MIEKIVLDYLVNKMDVDVKMEVPSNPPAEYVIIEKTGSSAENHVFHATIVIQCYSNTLYKAALLNEKVKFAMIGDGTNSFGIIGEVVDVSKCELNADYNATDTQNKKYRYQAVYDLVY